MLRRTSDDKFLFLVDLEPEELKAVRDALIDITCNYLVADGADPAAAYWILRFLLAEMSFNDEQLCQIAEGKQA